MPINRPARARVARVRMLWLPALWVSMVLTGCQSTTTISQQFPQTWPTGMAVPAVRKTRPPGPGSGIAVAVAPWTWPGAENTTSHPSTTEILTQLTQATLTARGFTVVDDANAAYRLGCSVRDLRYTVRDGVPGRRAYTAHADCQLLDLRSQQLLWQRQFNEVVDETLYVNTYTRIPAHHERLFAHESLPSLMERVTDSLLRFFREGLPRYEQATGYDASVTTYAK